MLLLKCVGNITTKGYASSLRSRGVCISASNKVCMCSDFVTNRKRLGIACESGPA